ncbi:MAG: hypothetical protein ACRD4B_08715 [Acidobacteriota bacterium]
MTEESQKQLDDLLSGPMIADTASEDEVMVPSWWHGDEEASHSGLYVSLT